ncbi:MAG: helix-turn-helix transcriptional regulator [Tissierellia bacterium]|nr:helix-turn-helix transcriptional regulator [Tissierellia bacterium]
MDDINLCQNKAYSPHIRKTIDYMKVNYHKPLTLENIADCLGINKCYFCHLFKKEVGKNYSQFLNEIRIEKSKELLTDTDMSILDIALAVGYNNQSYYNMAFKKIVGITPLKYRKKFTL